MTVAELKAFLQQLPDDTEVVSYHAAGEKTSVSAPVFWMGWRQDPRVCVRWGEEASVLKEVLYVR